MANEYGLTNQAQALLDKVRNLFGASNVQVTSGRSSRTGVAGGSATSQHPGGNAFDFHVSGMTPAQVQATLAASPIPFGQSIQEYGAAAGAGLNHLGVGTKTQLLTGRNGRYSATNTATLPAANQTALAQASGFGRDSLVSFLGSDWGNSIADGAFGVGSVLSAPGDRIDAAVASITPDWNSWFVRIGLGMLALLVIGVALVMLAPKAADSLGVKLPPVIPV